MTTNPKQSFLFPKQSAPAAEGQSLVSLDDREHEQLQSTLKGIVQVFLESVEPNFSQPWTKDLPSSSAGILFQHHCRHFNNSMSQELDLLWMFDSNWL
jgi:hypothetical protein